MDYEKWFYRISKIMVLSGFFGFLAGFFAYRFFGVLYHALTIALFAIPVFVSGVYLNMFPGEKDSVYFWGAFTQLVLYWFGFLFVLVMQIYYALFSLSAAFLLMVMLIFYSWDRFKPEFYFQKLLGFSAYFLLTLTGFALIIGYRVSQENLFEILFILLFYITAGLIYAVNSTGIPYTYGEKARGKTSYLIVLSEISIVVGYYLYGFTAVILSALISFLFYLVLIKVETFPRWVNFVKNLRPITRPKHYNLLFAHIISFVFLPILLILYTLNYIGIVTLIHVFLFGFVLPEILGHGIVLLPILVRKKPRFSKATMLLSPLSGLAALLRLLGETNEVYSGISGGLVLLLVVLLALLAFKFRD